MQTFLRRICLILNILALITMPGSITRTAQAQQAVVQVVLFYSPTCPHCHEVIQNVLPPLVEEYGEQFEILGIDVTTAKGRDLFLSAGDHFHIPEMNMAVPMMIVGDQILLGSAEIPEKLPGLIDRHLAQGGLSWPAIPGLKEALAEIEGDGSQELDTGPAGVLQRFQQDLAGNTLAVIVLAGMLLSLAWVIVYLRRSRDAGNTGALQRFSVILIPLLCVAGAAVAGYLAYVETAQVEAVCGPVGDCNTVQQSEYARLFGLIPVGVLGLYGYAALFIAWLFSYFSRGETAAFASLLVFILALAGTLFSIYLTFLEPFVIGATCIWCLSSAVIMTALMWLSAPGARPVIERLMNRSHRSPSARRT